MAIWKEFKEFAVKGSVVDLAVGVVIGAAFQKIVNSMVNDLIMPPLGYFINEVDFKDLKVQLNETVSINYGNFIQTVIEFFIFAWAIFILIKFINRLRVKHEG
jgi:large conductance mechanosensitive channel